MQDPGYRTFCNFGPIGGLQFTVLGLGLRFVKKPEMIECEKSCHPARGALWGHADCSHAKPSKLVTAPKP